MLVQTVERFEARETPGLGRENAGGSYWIDIFSKNQWIVNSASTERELAAAVYVSQLLVRRARVIALRQLTAIAYRSISAWTRTLTLGALKRSLTGARGYPALTRSVRASASALGALYRALASPESPSGTWAAPPLLDHPARAAIHKQPSAVVGGLHRLRFGVDRRAFPSL